MQREVFPLLFFNSSLWFIKSFFLLLFLQCFFMSFVWIFSFLLWYTPYRQQFSFFYFHRRVTYAYWVSFFFTFFGCLNYFHAVMYLLKAIFSYFQRHRLAYWTLFISIFPPLLPCKTCPLLHKRTSTQTHLRLCNTSSLHSLICIHFQCNTSHCV